MVNRRVVALVLLTLLASIVGCAKLLDPNQIMELNRNGKWSQAAAASTAVIRESNRHGAQRFSDVSQAYFQKAYAELRLGKSERARSTLRELDSYLDGRGYTAATRWLYRETRALRRELSMSPAASQVRAGMTLEPVSAQAGRAVLRPETAKEVAAYVALCKRTGAEATVVVREGRVLAAWYRDPEPQLYDAGALGNVFEGGIAHTRSAGALTFAAVKEGVLKPAGMEETRIAASPDGSVDPEGPVYTTPGDLARLARWLYEIGYFASVEEHPAGSPWREMRTPKGWIAMGRDDTFVAVAGNLIVVRFQQLGVPATPRFQREAAPLLARLAVSR